MIIDPNPPIAFAPIDGREPIPQGPPTRPPRVGIIHGGELLLAGQPVPIQIHYDEGTRWVYIRGDRAWEPFPIVSYSGRATLTLDNGATFTTETSTPIVVTLPPGRSVATVTAEASTHVANKPTTVTSSPKELLAGQPTAVLDLPEVGPDRTLPVTEQGRLVQVHVTVPEGGYFPDIQAWIAPDERPQAWSTLERYGDGSTWRGAVAIGPGIGPRQVHARVTVAGWPDAAYASASFTAVDASPPVLTVDHPADGADVAVGDDRAVAVRGRLTDSQSGVAGGQAGVALALSEQGPWVPATPGPAGDWSQWSGVVTAPSLGPFVLHVRGMDAAGHAAYTRLSLAAVTTHTPGTLDVRLGDSQYLAALMAFARDHVRTPSGPVTGVDLRNALRQPVDELAGPDRAAALGAHVPENELRLPVRLLHELLDTADVDHAPAIAAARHARFVAHHSLLNSLGTTRTEVRRARGADVATRTALADRLGLALGGERPDQLDALLLDGATMTDEDLARLFGLTPPRAVPNGAPGLVLQWQRAAAHGRWVAEDAAHPLPHAVLDPDVVVAADIRENTARAGELRGLLQQRAEHLRAEEQRLFALLHPEADGGPAAPQRLARTVAAALPGVTIETLRDWGRQDEAGADISSALAGSGLSRPGLHWLLTVDQTAATGADPHGEDLTLTAWVLVAALRTRLTPAWRTEETAIPFSPDLFTDSRTAPDWHALRVEATARLAWRDRLRSRADTLAALEAAAVAAVAAAERVALPHVRDGLVAALAPTAGQLSPQDLLGALHHVDAAVSGSLDVPVIGHAVTAVQLLLTAVRARDEHPDSPAAAWTVPDEAAFDTGWQWLSTKAQWERAVTGWLFPEGLLDPVGTPNPSAPFVTLVHTVAQAGVRLTPEEADAAVDRYVAELQGLLTGRDIPVTDVAALMRERTTQAQVTLANRSRTMRAVGLLDLERETFWAMPLLIGTRLAASGHHRAALDWLWAAHPWTHPGTESASSVVGEEVASLAAPPPPDLTFPPGWTADLNPYHHLTGRTAPYLRATLLAIVRTLADQADAGFATGTEAAVGQARVGYTAALRVLDHQAFVPVPPSSPVEGPLPLPELAPLRTHVQTQLAKIRQGRDIAGSPRRRSTGSAPARFQPTPYRFATLLTRAQEMARHAAAVEALYLSLLERYDAGVLRLHEATGALALLETQTRVHEQRLEAAQRSVLAAGEQYDGTARVLTAYQQAAAAPANRYEQELFRQFKDLRNVQNAVATAQAGLATAQAFVAGTGGGLLSFGGSLAAAVVAARLSWALAGAQGRANLVSEQISANQLRAGIEERRRSLVLQAAGVELNLIAARHARQSAVEAAGLAAAELDVVRLQALQADRTLALLRAQFTNPDLYLWLSRCIGGLYRYHLQQAAATARLAQAQLAFERVEDEIGVIAADYWRPGPGRGDGPGTPADTRGLTGAEYLQRDLARLDEHAFTVNERRLNITQTFSLAELAPADLLEFRRTGRLVIPTPEGLFDQDFPGHHHRLLRQVRVSLVALVPPVRGIRATLSNAGISRVVTPAAHGTFTTVELVHEPTTVALTSPSGASGVFALDAQPELVQPFEGAGVDTVWVFDLPPAANPIDYASIADVQLSLDYTALADEALRAQVVRRLDAEPTREADRVFSLAHDAPDAWWALHQVDPARPDGSRVAELTLAEHDLPSRLAGRRLVQLAAGVLRADGGGIPEVRLSLGRDPAAVAEAVTDARGVASTRRGAPAWSRLLGTDPVGSWQVGVDAATAARIDAGEADDLVLVLTVRGEVPRWDG